MCRSMIRRIMGTLEKEDPNFTLWTPVSSEDLDIVFRDQHVVSLVWGYDGAHDQSYTHNTERAYIYLTDRSRIRCALIYTFDDVRHILGYPTVFDGLT